MTNYFKGSKLLVPFTNVSHVSNLHTDDITIYIKRSQSSFTLAGENATKFLSQYLAWLDSQAHQPRSL